MKPRKSQSYWPCMSNLALYFLTIASRLASHAPIVFERTNHHSTTTNSMLDRSAPKKRRSCYSPPTTQMQVKKELTSTYRARSPSCQDLAAEGQNMAHRSSHSGAWVPHHTKMGVTPSVKKRRFSSPPSTLAHCHNQPWQCPECRSRLSPARA
jgi:hypothetical protein